MPTKRGAASISAPSHQKSTDTSTPVADNFLVSFKRRNFHDFSNTCTINPSSTHSETSSLNKGPPTIYDDFGDCDQLCPQCGALFWFTERLRNQTVNTSATYNRCCAAGTIRLPQPPDPPELLKSLLSSNDKKGEEFRNRIRGYNDMFAMTSFGADVDATIYAGSGPYVFKIGGQIYHAIGGLCPHEHDRPKFLQLYIYDTENELNNRLSAFGGTENSNMDMDLVSQLTEMLDKHNELIKLFRSAKQKCIEGSIPNYSLRLYRDNLVSNFELPTAEQIGALIIENGDRTNLGNDIVTEYKKDGGFQRISRLHPCYMSLQFPLIFFYGEPGYKINIPLLNRSDHSTFSNGRVTMRQYYCFQMHDRMDSTSLLTRTGRLFQHYMVNSYVCIEQDRLCYVQTHQDNLRTEFVDGIHDAIARGDNDGSNVGARIILPSSFTGGPRYMYSHYQDALAICRELGNPDFFITFTCNVNWPEIKRHVAKYPGMRVEDRADIVSRVFHLKVQDFISYLKNKKPFGEAAGG